MTEHADIGPSALHRLLACPGSHRLSKSRPRGKTSIYAAEGTVAHEICEECLNDGFKTADAYLGEKRHADGFDFVVDEEMVEGCNLYIQHCRDMIPKGDVAWYRVEERVDLGALWIDGPPEPIFGTADFVAFDRDKSHMNICDLKYGRGDVSPAENPQAMAYALGAVLTFGLLPAVVDIYIVQPRGQETQGVKHWRTTGLDLMAWGTEVLKPGVEKLLDPAAPLSPGTHCKFCPALATCPALRQISQDTAREQFSPVPPDPGGLSDEELSKILDRVEIIRPWLDAVQAEASMRLDKGFKVPGWKLVPKRAMRKWADKYEVEAWAREHSESIFKEVLETPTQVEKKYPDAYQALQDKGLIDSSSTGTTLVPDHDPREALSQKLAKDEFSVV